MPRRRRRVHRRVRRHLRRPAGACRRPHHGEHGKKPDRSALRALRQRQDDDRAEDLRGARAARRAHAQHLDGQLFQERLPGDDAAHARREVRSRIAPVHGYGAFERALLRPFRRRAHPCAALRLCASVPRSGAERFAASEEKRGRRVRGHPRAQGLDHARPPRGVQALYQRAQQHFGR